MLQEEDQKIYKINEKICCSTAGNVALSNTLLEKADNETKSYEGGA